MLDSKSSLLSFPLTRDPEFCGVFKFDIDSDFNLFIKVGDEVADSLGGAIVEITDVRPETNSPSYAVKTLEKSVCCGAEAGVAVIDLADCQDCISDQFGV